ncbi:hypothetical protein AAVH_08250 [Aphelenchoides avenae]|nr:hypothetical protein AAVH_08250 [Aphelenchus avenae]
MLNATRFSAALQSSAARALSTSTRASSQIGPLGEPSKKDINSATWTPNPYPGLQPLWHEYMKKDKKVVETAAFAAEMRQTTRFSEQDSL